MSPGMHLHTGPLPRRSVPVASSPGQQPSAPRRKRQRQGQAPSTPKAASIAAPTTKGPHVLDSRDKEDCTVFVDKDGNVLEAMCCDYGFRSGFGRLYQGGDGEIPKNFLQLGWDNYKKEFRQLRRSFRTDEYNEISELNPARNALSRLAGSVGKQFVRGMSAIDHRLESAGVLSPLEDPEQPEEATESDGGLTRDCRDMKAQLAKLELSNDEVWKKEEHRVAQPDWGPKNAPWPIRGAYLALCIVLDRIYDRRPIQRFWFLEVVARMPYFAFISMLHLYESLGWWRAGAELRKVHFAEEWNELHHLMIMESLGGDQLWVDRFMAQHAAVFYYWLLIAFYSFSPQLAYMFSEMVEGHATDTYDQFAEQNKELLTSLPPPLVALEYYKGGDLYMFDALRSGRKQPARRPACNNLYDVFDNIRKDEQEHVKTMTACRDYSIVDDLVADKKDRGAPGAPTPSANMDTSQLQ